VTNVTLQELLEVNQNAHAQMDNGITMEFVKIVTTLVKLVQDLQPLVLLAQKTLQEHYLTVNAHVTKDIMIMVLKYVENV